MAQSEQKAKVRTEGGIMWDTMDKLVDEDEYYRSERDSLDE